MSALQIPARVPGAPGRRQRRGTASAARTAVIAILLAVGALFGGSPAWADGGQSTAEGYVMVQQALSYLVNDPASTAGALAMVDKALSAPDQDGVAVPTVQAAKTALQAGNTDQARILLQDSITAAVASLKPAVGEQTGTTTVLPPLPPRSGLSGTDWLFLALSALVAVGGILLSVLFRPHESLRDLRRDIEGKRQ